MRIAAILLAAANLFAQDRAFTSAFAQFQAGNLEAAQKILQTAPHPTALDLNLLGTIEFQQNNLSAAERHLRSAVALQPGMPGARSTLATLLNSRARSETDNNQIPQAEAHLNESQKLAPKDARPLLGLARIRNMQGNHEAALALTLKAKKISPDDPHVLYALGAVCLEMDLIKDATTNLQLSADLEPNNPITLYALASAQLAMRNYQPAIDIYKSLLAADPANPQVTYALGVTYYLQGDYTSAKTLLSQSAAAQSEQVESYYYLALIADQEGDSRRNHCARPLGAGDVGPADTQNGTGGAEESSVGPEGSNHAPATRDCRSDRTDQSFDRADHDATRRGDASR